jgi:hypothetical protein
MRRARVPFLLLAAVVAAATISACGSSSGGSGGNGDVVLWHGYDRLPGKVTAELVDQFNAGKPGFTVKARYAGPSDDALAKTLTSITAGNFPDAVYLFGSDMATIARSPKVATWNDYIAKHPDFDWEDFFPGERKAATVNGKVVGVPALVDNLALVYNKISRKGLLAASRGSSQTADLASSGGAAAGSLSGVDGRGEPRWQPISMLPMIASLIDEGLRDGREHYATLLEARPKPHVLDDAMIARTKRVNGEGLERCGVYDRQLLRWRAQRLTDAQRREIARLEDVQRDLRLVLTQILELADELGHGTIERQLTKSDLELGLEYVLRSQPRA